MNTINWTTKALKQLLKIGVKPIEQKIKNAVSNELVDFSQSANIKKLTNHDYDYRLRVGDYRVLFTYESGQVSIVTIEEVKKEMNALTNVQVLHHAGVPTFVVIAYHDYMDIVKDKKTDATIPHDVVSLMVDKDMSIFKAWRTYKKLTQEQVAQSMGVAQSAVARIESGKHEPTISTLKAYAKAIGVLPEQIDLSD